jgi:hypothetical protein
MPWRNIYALKKTPCVMAAEMMGQAFRPSLFVGLASGALSGLVCRLEKHDDITHRPWIK